MLLVLLHCVHLLYWGLTMRRWPLVGRLRVLNVLGRLLGNLLRVDGCALVRVPLKSLLTHNVGQVLHGSRRHVGLGIASSGRGHDPAIAVIKACHIG